MKASGHALNLVAAARAAAASRPPARAVERVLVVGYGAIGDTIFFLPVLEALRGAYPRAKFVWVSNPSSISVELIPATGLVDEVWTWEAQVEDPAGRAAINRRIAAAGFDLAVLTIGAPAHEFVEGLRKIPIVAGHLFPWQGLKRFLIFGDYARRALVNHPASALLGERVLARNLRLLSALGIAAPNLNPRPALPVPPEARRAAENLLEGIVGAPIAVHLGPPRNQYHKMWAPESFAGLSRSLAASGARPLVLLGSAEEEESERAFRAAGGVCERSLVGRAPLLVSFAILERCALLVSNDTGVAKAAAALGTPTATIWGPSDPGEVGSPWEREKHLDIRTGIACSPCALFSAAKPDVLNYLICGHHDCLRRLEAEFVFAALRSRYGSILDRKAGRP